MFVRILTYRNEVRKTRSNVREQKYRVWWALSARYERTEEANLSWPFACYFYEFSRSQSLCVRGRPWSHAYPRRNGCFINA